LRAGVKLIPYLETGRYYGVDKSQDLLTCGRDLELKAADRLKNPTLAVMESFDFGSLGQRFDFAIAQSVFTHLPLNQIALCLWNAGRVLKPSATLYATFFESASDRRFEPKEWYTTDGLQITTHFDSDPYHYDLDSLRWACKRTQLTLRYIGEWNHPRRQRMVGFRKRKVLIF
jgi:hypothetical protein